MKLKLPLQSYPIKSVRQNPARLINMYAVGDDAEGKNSVALYPTPGLKVFCDTSGQVVRGMITVHGIVYLVKDNVFGKLTSAGVFTSIGSISTSSGKVSMAAIFDQVLVATGSTAYLYKITAATFAAVSDSDFPVNCSFVLAQDEYFVAIQPNSDTYWISDISDGTSWNSLNFAAVQGKSGDLVCAISIFQQIWFLKDSEQEVWYNAGGDFPFSRQEGASINYGCVAPFSLAQANNTTFWLGQALNGTGYVITTAGSEPKIISTAAEHYQWATYTTISDAFSYTFQQEGSEFYVLTFPTENKTWVYNIQVDKWHEWDSINTISITPPDYTRHRANCYSYLQGKHLVGDFSSGKVFELDTNTFMDDTSNIIRRQVITPNLSLNGKMINVYSLELFVEVGQGLNSGQGINPLISLEVSRDGGFTWGNKRFQSLGALGNYRQRVKWNLLGTARDFSFRITVTDPIKFILIGGQLEVDAEDSDLTNFQFR